jgi:predicted porin
MNKKLVAVAIAGVLAAPLAQAQTANVTLYGRLNLDMEFVNGKQLAPGAQVGTCSTTAYTTSTCRTQNPNQFRISSNSSNFGMRGTESLGGGLNAIFQVESGITADNAANNTTTTSQILATRNTFIGLQGSWGDVKLGFFHLPYDNLIASTWGSNPTLETGILGSASIWAQGTQSKQNGGFDSRIGNTVMYSSPMMSGWQAQFSYSIGGAPTMNEGTPKSNSAVMAGGVKYANGPIQFAAAFQYNEQVRVAGLNDIAYSFAGAYQFPGVKLGAIYERLDYDCGSVASGTAACQTSPGAGGSTSLTRNMYGVDLTINAGPGLVYVMWEYGDNGKGSAPTNARIGGLAKGDNSSSNQWEISYTYPLSKRTSLYTGYTQIINKSNANYNFGVNPYPIAIGGKPQGFVAGMWMNF